MFYKISNYDRGMELENCTFMKTVLMLLIVVFHSILAWNGSWFSTIKLTYSNAAFEIVSSWLSTFHVYTFACVSGYIFYYCKYEKRAATYSNFLKFIINKIKRLIVPYYVVAILWVAPAKQFFYPINFKTFFKSYILGEDAEQLWFLLMLFVVFVMAYLSSNFIKKHSIWGIIICGIAFIIGMVVTAGIPNIFCFRTALQYMPFFYLGFWIRQYGLGKKIHWEIWLIINISLFILSRHIVVDSTIKMGIYLIVQFVLHIVSVIFMWGLLQKIATSFYIKIKKSKRWRVLAENSMGIYMFHMQIIYFTLYIFNGILIPSIHAIVNFSFAFVISLLITMVLKKYKVTRFLIGG